MVSSLYYLIFHEAGLASSVVHKLLPTYITRPDVSFGSPSYPVSGGQPNVLQGVGHVASMCLYKIATVYATRSFHLLRKYFLFIDNVPFCFTLSSGGTFADMLSCFYALIYAEPNWFCLVFAANFVLLVLMEKVQGIHWRIRACSCYSHSLSEAYFFWMERIREFIKVIYLLMRIPAAGLWKIYRTWNVRWFFPAGLFIPSGSWMYKNSVSASHFSCSCRIGA